MKLAGRGNKLALVAGAALWALAGCNAPQEGARATLERFFGSAQHQDYAATYDCYYQRYKEKVDRDEFVRHRKEASVLKEYRLVSVAENGDRAQAVAMLTFAPSAKLQRSEPVNVKVTEDLVKEDGQWKIKVW